MTFAQHYRQEGMQQGEHLGVEKTLEALELLKKAHTVEAVAQKTGLVLEDVSKIKSRWVH